MRARRAALAVLVAVLATLLGATAAQGQDAEQQLRVRVFTGQGPNQERIGGVAFTVADPDGEQVGEGVTDDNGEALVPLPAPGQYTVTLDPGTLPEGLVPASGALELSPPPVQAGRTGNALFNLVEGELGAVASGGGPGFGSRFARVPQLVLDGIKLGAIIAITSIGLSLIYGTTGLVNFAHGDMVTFGAMVAFWLNVTGPRLHLLLAAPFAIAAGGLLGYGMERGIWNPLRARKVGLISMLVISIGLSFVLRFVLQILFGGGTRPYRNYNLQDSVRVFGQQIAPRDLWIIGLSLVVLVAVGLMLNRTKIGKAMRAVSDNRDLAESSGIDVARVIRFVWLLGGALAAFGGVLLGTTEQVRYLMGFNLLLLMFAGVILGGIGTAYGAIFGALVVGIVTQVSTAFVSTQLKLVWGLLVLIVVLLVRPQGILGRAERFG